MHYFKFHITWNNGSSRSKMSVGHKSFKILKRQNLKVHSATHFEVV